VKTGVPVAPLSMRSFWKMLLMSFSTVCSVTTRRAAMPLVRAALCHQLEDLARPGSGHLCGERFQRRAGVHVEVGLDDGRVLPEVLSPSRYHGV
jgi:hypothetical protein